MWRKLMVYLGLGPDEEYDEYDVDDDDPRLEPARRAPGRSTRVPAMSSAGRADEPAGSLRTVTARSPEPRAETGSASPADGGGSGASVATRPQVVRPLAVSPHAKPHVLVPTSFNEAQELADTFKGCSPVIVNLQGAERDLSRRLIDFASGLCYGLGGQMEKVANQVYLLTPSNVEVSAEERRRLQERGYDG